MMDKTTAEADYRFLDYRITHIAMTLLPVKTETQQNQVETTFHVAVRLGEKGTGQTKVDAAVTAWTMPKEGEPREKVLTLSMTIIGQFAAAREDISQEDMIHFLNLNGVAALLPIARAAILNTMQTANISHPFILPMMNVYHMQQNQ